MAALAAAMGRPAPAWAASAAVMTEAEAPAAAQTGIRSSQSAGSSAVFAAYATAPTARVYALFGQTDSPTGFGSYAFAPSGGVGACGRSTAAGVGVIGSAGVAEPDPAGMHGIGVRGLGNLVGVRGEGEVGVRGLGSLTGVHGEGNTGVYGTGEVGVYGLAVTPSASGVVGRGDAGTGVRTSTVSGSGLVATASGTGTAVVATAASGTALNVTGKTKLSRSGRTSIAKNRTYVDVSLVSRGGVSSSSLCFATLQLARTGVYIRAVKPNSTAGTIRIYLNKVASTTSSTPVAWLVLENPV